MVIRPHARPLQTTTIPDRQKRRLTSPRRDPVTPLLAPRVAGVVVQNYVLGGPVFGPVEAAFGGDGGCGEVHCVAGLGGQVGVPGVGFVGVGDVDADEGVGGAGNVEVGFEVYDVVVEGAGDGVVDAVAVFVFVFVACGSG